MRDHDGTAGIYALLLLILAQLVESSIGVVVLTFLAFVILAFSAWEVWERYRLYRARTALEDNEVSIYVYHADGCTFNEDGNMTWACTSECPSLTARKEKK